MTDETKKITAIECRFATFCQSKDTPDDIHVIKEVVHYDDNTTERRLKTVKNFKRPIYITKPGKRNFKDKKEWMDLTDLDRFETTQSRMVESVAKALGKPWLRGSLKDLCESPYVFGADITTSSIIKQMYKDKWTTQTPYLNACFDTETDMLHGTNEIIMATISCKETVYTCVSKHFVRAFPNPEKSIREMAARLLKDDIKERNLNFIIEFADSAFEITQKCFAKAHEIKPDFVSIWNIEFDMRKMLEACKQAEVDPANVFCDPSIPFEYRHFKYTEGKAKKTTASGRVMNFKPSQRWHSVKVPATFTMIDAMQSYVKIRQGSPELPSYSLDSILQKELKGRTKLKIPEAEKYRGGKWHVFMQQNYPIEYIVYNMFDCIGMEILDEKTMDLALSLPMFAGSTDFANFNSLPTRAMNELHWTCRELGKVPGSTAREMADELDDAARLDGWIVMLASHTVADNGLCVIEEVPDLRTNIRIGVADWK